METAVPRPLTDLNERCAYRRAGGSTGDHGAVAGAAGPAAPRTAGTVAATVAGTVAAVVAARVAARAAARGCWDAEHRQAVPRRGQRGQLGHRFSEYWVAASWPKDQTTGSMWPYRLRPGQILPLLTICTWPTNLGNAVCVCTIG